MMTDLVADMLTRIRNAVRQQAPAVEVLHSKLTRAVADALKREGYIRDYTPLDIKPKPLLRVYLKYGPEGQQVITGIRRTSKPGRRVYRGVHELEPVLKGLGISIVSTPNGVLSDRECRKQRVGGEVLCRVW